MRAGVCLSLLLIVFSAGEVVAGEPAPHVPRLGRWLELQAGTIAGRYKRSAASESPWVYQLQYQVVARGRVKFDRGGRFSAGFRLGTGEYFTHSWNSTGAGQDEFEGRIHLKELYFSATPCRGFELQYGWLGFSRGESSEVTSYSNNGYLTGERISVRRPDKLFFDEISATGAYVGDPYASDVSDRFKRLSQMNYHQFLVSKKLAKNVSVSGDYTMQDGVETLRQALRINLHGHRFVDALIFDNYERLQIYPSWGCAFWVQKNPVARLTLNGGFVNIDQHYINLNSDRLGRGKRLYVIATYNFWRDFSAGFFAGKAFANDFAVGNAARFDFVISYDFLKALKRHEIL